MCMNLGYINKYLCKYSMSFIEISNNIRKTSLIRKKKFFSVLGLKYTLQCLLQVLRSVLVEPFSQKFIFNNCLCVQILSYVNFVGRIFVFRF